VIKESDAGQTLTFACDVGSHCEFGQIVNFLVAGNPTANPTSSPTENPSSSPTGESTSSPTGKPTSSPTGKSTSSPTGKPVINPVASPMSSPVASPMNSPVTSAAMFRGDGVRRVAIATMLAVVSLCITLW